MDSSNDQNEKRNNVGKIILLGFGYAVGGFIAGTIITAIAVILFFEILAGDRLESFIFFLIVVSPKVGLAVAIIAGILGAIKANKKLSAK